MLQSTIQTPGRLNLPLPHVDSEKLGQFSDEELCQKAQQGCRASSTLLWQRYHDFVKRVVYKKNCQYHLLQREMADALQEAYFAFHDAVHQYNPECRSCRKPVAFKTFLGLVIARSFSNFYRRWRRYRRRVVLHLDGETPSNLILDTEEEHVNLHSSNGNDTASADWKRMILEELSSDGLAEILSRLKSKEIHLLQIWLQSGRDKEVTRVLGISNAAAKLRRERLFRHIKSRFLQAQSS